MRSLARQWVELACLGRASIHCEQSRRLFVVRKRVANRIETHGGIPRGEAMAPKWLQEPRAVGMARRFRGGGTSRPLERIEGVAVKDAPPRLTRFGVGDLAYHVLREGGAGSLRGECTGLRTRFVEQSASEQFIEAAQCFPFRNARDSAHLLERELVSQNGGRKERVTRVSAQSLDARADHVTHGTRHQMAHLPHVRSGG